MNIFDINPIYSADRLYSENLLDVVFVLFYTFFNEAAKGRGILWKKTNLPINCHC